MGYATSNGVIQSGGETTRLLKSFTEGGVWGVRQKSVTTSTHRSGVSLATCQSYHASDNLTSVAGGSGAYEWVVIDAEGTRTYVQYSQIGDSNLYDLTVTTEKLNAWLSKGGVRVLT